MTFLASLYNMKQKYIFYFFLLCLLSCSKDAKQDGAVVAAKTRVDKVGLQPNKQDEKLNDVQEQRSIFSQEDPPPYDKYEFLSADEISIRNQQKIKHQEDEKKKYQLVFGDFIYDETWTLESCSDHLKRLAVLFADRSKQLSSTSDFLFDLHMITQTPQYQLRDTFFVSLMLSDVGLIEVDGILSSQTIEFLSWISQSKEFSDNSREIRGLRFEISWLHEMTQEKLATVEELWFMAEPTSKDQMLNLYSSKGRHMSLDMDSEQPDFPIILLSAMPFQYM